MQDVGIVLGAVLYFGALFGVAVLVGKALKRNRERSYGKE